jgi:hypothetical protein
LFEARPRPRNPACNLSPIESRQDATVGSTTAGTPRSAAAGGVQVQAAFQTMNNLCDECNRLWRDFAFALGEQLCASIQLRRAALARDVRRVAHLLNTSQENAANRARAQLAIQLHEARAHLVEETSPNGCSVRDGKREAGSTVGLA